MKAKEYIKILTELSNHMDLAIHVVDKEGKSIVYNEKMAEIEKICREDVLGKFFLEVFSHVGKEQSTLWKALNGQIPTPQVQQTYLNAYGKEITTINSTFPVIDEAGVSIAAIEIARDITEIKDLSETVMQLQNKTISSSKTAKPEIKKYCFDDLKGVNLEFKSVVDRAKRAADSNASVFIYGETGTGKELFAQSIHYASGRSQKPFLAQNCAALPESLLEGILFGTVKGGFTGAVDRAGLFEQANGGTLLLDEISAMPYELQSKLLRVLQEDYIRRVGGTKDIPVDVRIIATVNEDPMELIKQGRLRRDLYYRLNIIDLRIPPLRKRKEDIPILVDFFVDKHNERFGKEVWLVSEKSMEKLEKYDYPGNVRELENIIMSAVSMSGKEHVIMENMLSFSHAGTEEKKEKPDYDSSRQSMEDYISAMEKSIINDAMIRNFGNISRTAAELSLKRQTLQHKLKKYNIKF